MASAEDSAAAWSCCPAAHPCWQSSCAAGPASTRSRDQAIDHDASPSQAGHPACSSASPRASWPSVPRPLTAACALVSPPGQILAFGQVNVDDVDYYTIEYQSSSSRGDKHFISKVTIVGKKVERAPNSRASSLNAAELAGHVTGFPRPNRWCLSVPALDLLPPPPALSTSTCVTDFAHLIHAASAMHSPSISDPPHPIRANHLDGHRVSALCPDSPGQEGQV